MLNRRSLLRGLAGGSALGGVLLNGDSIKAGVPSATLPTCNDARQDDWMLEIWHPIGYFVGDGDSEASYLAQKTFRIDEALARKIEVREMHVGLASMTISREERRKRSDAERKERGAAFTLDGELFTIIHYGVRIGERATKCIAYNEDIIKYYRFYSMAEQRENAKHLVSRGWSLPPEVAKHYALSASRQ